MLKLEEMARVGSHGGHISKIDRFGWQLHGKRGVYLDIPKEELVIDHTYQREAIKEKTVLGIAREFNWAAFGVVIVAARQDGRYVVIDGQHRVLGARKRADISDLPCLVFELVDIADEAKAFTAVNMYRGSVNTVDQYRAALVAKDPAAQAIEQILISNGIVASGNGHGGTISCMNAMHFAAMTDIEALRVAFPIAVAVAEGKPVAHHALAALWYLQRATVGAISTPESVRRIRTLGRERILNACKKAINFHGKSGPKVWASGLLTEFNKGRRSNRLTVPGLGQIE